MIRAQFCLISTLQHIIFILCQLDKFDDQWDQKVMGNDQDLKCGIENKYQTETTRNAHGTARILNGRTINVEKYPWMAEIFHVFYYPNGTLHKGVSCAGSVISRKAILRKDFPSSKLI